MATQSRAAGLTFAPADVEKAGALCPRVSSNVGRSVKVKKKLLEKLMSSLAHSGFNTENVMVCFKGTSWENWSFGGGRLIHT